MKQRNLFLFALFSLLVISCSEQPDYEIQDLKSHNLKGNVKEIYCAVFYAFEQFYDDDFDNKYIPHYEVFNASYNQYDKNGVCTNITEYIIPQDSCKISSYLVTGKNGNIMEFAKWRVDTDVFHDKICHYTYYYNDNGKLVDTRDKMYDWLLHKNSSPVSENDMKLNLDGYYYILTQGDTLAALNFSKEKGLTNYVHFCMIDGKKYTISHVAKSDVYRKCELKDGKILKNEWKDGILETFEYDGNIIVKAQQKSKDGYSNLEYENGRLKKILKYDTGNNLVLTTEYSYSGNIKKNGTIKYVEIEQNGDKTTHECYFENGRQVKQIDKKDSTIITEFKYNENGDLVYTKTDKEALTRKYKYDDKGNWIYCVIYNEKDEPSYVIERFFIYYD